MDTTPTGPAPARPGDGARDDAAGRGAGRGVAGRDRPTAGDEVVEDLPEQLPEDLPEELLDVTFLPRPHLDTLNPDTLGIGVLEDDMLAATAAGAPVSSGDPTHSAPATTPAQSAPPQNAGPDHASAPAGSVGAVLDGAPSWVARRVLESLTALTETAGGDLNEREILDVIGAWHKQAASAHAQLLSWINVLTHRPRMTRHSPTITAAQATTSEVQFALATTKRRAATLVADAHHLTGPLWPVHEALTHGLIDPAKASLFTEILTGQSLTAQITVVDTALPAAPGLDHTALRRHLCDLLVACDPDGVTTRTRAAITQRRVNRPRPAGNGMAFFTAYLPAPAATALDHACEAAARATRATGDTRTLDQLRADALTTLAEHALLTGTIGAPTITIETLTFDATHARVHLHATEQAQRGQRSPTPADALEWELSTPAATRGEPNPYLNTPPTVDTQACRDCGRTDCDGQGNRIDNHGSNAVDDHTEDHDGDHTEDHDDDGDHDDDHDGAWAGPPITPPPYLHGYGAIPPALVPALAAQPWIQIHTPTPPGDAPPPAPGYRPTAELDRHVRTRDITCQAPGCSVPAWQCDLDHVTPYPEGPTTADNLRALCRHHHRMKTIAGHTYTITPNGTLRWTTPTGNTLYRDQHGYTHLPGHTDHTTKPEHLDLPPETDKPPDD